MSQMLTQPESLPDRQLDDLSDVINAYNRVTESLRQSHETLRGEVVRLQQQLA